MKVPKSYEGKLVCAHLGAPVYMFSYGVHAKIGGKDYLMPGPILKEVSTPEGVKQSQAMSNMLVGALVKEVTDDTVLFELFDPAPGSNQGTVMHKLVPSALIVSLDTVAAVDAEMPTATQRVIAQPSRLVMP